MLGDHLRREARGAASSHALRMVFPMTHFGRVRKHAKEKGLDEVLMLSLIKQESAFFKEAISSSGALGLMQLMPFTAIDMDPKVKQSSVIDVDTNLALGTKYFKRVKERFLGNVALSLAAYNAGPHRVRQWVGLLDSEASLLEFVELIPFRETRGYVSGIMRNYFWYYRKVHGKRLDNFDSFFENIELLRDKWPKET